jgi:hypothetical protein
MKSNFSVSIPQKNSTVTFESISPEIPPARKTFTTKNKTEYFGMDELEEGDSPLSESQDVEDVYAASVIPPQLEKTKPRRNKSSRRSTTKDEVFHVAVTIPRAARHDACPAGFNVQGDLFKAWAYLNQDIEQARGAHITSQEVQRLDSEPGGPAKDHNEQQSTENEQQAHKSSTSYANKRQKPNPNTTNRIIQPVETNGTNNRGIFPHTEESSNHSKFPPSNEFASHLLPRVGEGAIDTPTSSPRYTRANEIQLGSPTGTNAQPAIIVCSDQGCAKRQFDARYLGQYCGIDFKDAKLQQQRDQYWLCPECAHKSAVLHGHNNPVAHGSITRLPKFGNKRLEDDFLRDFLRQLSGILTAYSARAASKSVVPNLQMPVWDNPCVRDEMLNPVAGRANPFVSHLRQLLDVPDGVTIKDKVDHYQLHGYRNSLWVRGVLVSLFSDAVFRQGSPFESDDILHQSLEYGKSRDIRLF